MFSSMFNSAKQAINSLSSEDPSKNPATPAVPPTPNSTPATNTPPSGQQEHEHTPKAESTDFLGNLMEAARGVGKSISERRDADEQRQHDRPAQYVTDPSAEPANKDTDNSKLVAGIEDLVGKAATAIQQLSGRNEAEKDVEEVVVSVDSKEGKVQLPSSFEKKEDTSTPVHHVDPDGFDMIVVDSGIEDEIPKVITGGYTSERTQEAPSEDKNKESKLMSGIEAIVGKASSAVHHLTGSKTEQEPEKVPYTGTAIPVHKRPDVDGFETVLVPSEEEIEKGVAPKESELEQKGMATNIGTAIKDFGKAGVDVISDVGKDTFDATRDVVATVGGATVSAAANAVEKTFEGAAWVGHKTMDAGKSAFGATESALGIAAGKVEEGEEQKAREAEARENALSPEADPMDAAKEKAGNIIGSAIGKTKEGALWLKDEAQRAGHAAYGAAMSAVDAKPEVPADKKEEAAKEDAQKWEEGQGLNVYAPQEPVAEEKKEGSSWLKDAKESGSAAMDTAQRGVLKVLEPSQQGISWVKQGAAQLGDDASNAGRDIMDKTSEAAETVTDKAKEGTDWMKDQSDRAGTAAKDVGQSFIDSSKEGASWMKDRAQVAGTASVDAGKGAYDTTSGVIGTAVEKTKEGVEAAIDKTKEAALWAKKKAEGVMPSEDPGPIPPSENVIEGFMSPEDASVARTTDKQYQY